MPRTACPGQHPVKASNPDPKSPSRPYQWQTLLFVPDSRKMPAIETSVRKSFFEYKKRHSLFSARKMGSVTY
jgi:hypothetical protein